MAATLTRPMIHALRLLAARTLPMAGWELQREGVTVPTKRSLERNGYVTVAIRTGGYSGDWTITDAGRAALAARDGGT